MPVVRAMALFMESTPIALLGEKEVPGILNIFILH
jgi:hypothetical protein